MRFTSAPTAPLLLAALLSLSSTLAAIPNADPTGKLDSAPALNAFLRARCSCDAAVCADAVVDLDGGMYRMAAPLAIDSTVVCAGKIRIRGGTLLADAALAQHGNSSFLVTILDHWKSGGVSIDAVTFASNGTGGGLRVDSAGHTHVTDCTFLNFATVGIWGSKLLPGSGHDLSVDRCTLTECTKSMQDCADIRHKKATAILIEFPDSHFRNSVITCGLRGIISRAGANDFRGLHIWTSCTGVSARGANTTVAFADEAGGSRITDCYFDNADLVISGYRGSTISNSYFNSGANLVLKPPTTVSKDQPVNLTDPHCQYWRGAVCALTVVANQFLCGATSKAGGGRTCPIQCATIDTSQYAIPAAADVYLSSNAFEGKAPDASVCTRDGRHSCAGTQDCGKLFTTCPRGADGGVDEHGG